MRRAIALMGALIAGASEWSVQAQTSAPAAEHSCTKARDAFACLLENFSEFYRTDYAGFFAVFNEEAKRVQACTEPQRTARFLRLYTVVGVNAEATEAVAEIVDRLVVRDPRCVLRGVALLADAEQKVVFRALKTPLFASGAEVEAAIISVRSDTALEPLVRAFLEL